MADYRLINAVCTYTKRYHRAQCLIFFKIEVVTYYLTNPQYSFKQVSISCFVNHGPHMLNASVLMVLFELLCHDCDP